jgi:pyridoxine 5'-phosphate synthase PdxJ
MDTTYLINISKVCKNYEIKEALLIALSDFDLIQIKQLDDQQYIHENDLAVLEKMVRLHNDLAINLEGLEVINNLLVKISQLNKEVSSLKTQLNRYKF